MATPAGQGLFVGPPGARLTGLFPPSSTIITLSLSRQLCPEPTCHWAALTSIRLHLEGCCVLTPVCPFCPGGQQLTPIHLCSNHSHSLAPTGTCGHPYECIECRLWAPGHFIQKLVFFLNVILERLPKSLNLFLKAMPLKGLMWAWGSLHRGSLWCLNLEGLPWGPPARSVSGRRIFSS